MTTSAHTDVEPHAERRVRGAEYAWVLPWVLAAIGFLTTLALLR
jgi:hypothetical protein